MTIEAEFISPITEKDALLFRRLQAREEIGRLSEYQVELLRPTDTKKTFVKPKDPLEYLKKIRFHRSVKGAAAYGL